MMPTRRGFFTFLAAIPFAPKCILAMRPKPAAGTAYAYLENGHTFYALSARPSLEINRLKPTAQMILDEQRFLDHRQRCAMEARAAFERDRGKTIRAASRG